MEKFFEMLMLIFFGLSWPVSLLKSYRAKTTKGKSLLFIFFIWIGYVFGITAKIIKNDITYAFIFYIINIVMVSLDILLYFRNKRLDKERDEAATI